MAIENVSGPSANWSDPTGFETALDNLGGDVNARLAALILANARGARQGADTARDEEEEFLEAAEAEQVAALHREADAIRAQGGWTLGADVLNGAVELGGAAGVKGIDAFKGAADAGGAGARYLAKDAEGDQKDAAGVGAQAKNVADASQRRLQDIGDVRKDARQLFEDAINFLRDSNRTKGDIEHTGAGGIRA